MGGKDVECVGGPPQQAQMRRQLQQKQLGGGFPSLPAGRRLIWNLAFGMKLFDESVNVPLRYHVAITGRGPFGPLPRLEYTLDLADMRGTAGAPQGSLHDVATAIGKLETDRHRRLSPEDGPAARAVTAAAARTR